MYITNYVFDEFNDWTTLVIYISRSVRSSELVNPNKSMWC